MNDHPTRRFAPQSIAVFIASLLALGAGIAAAAAQLDSDPPTQHGAGSTRPPGSLPATPATGPTPNAEPVLRTPSPIPGYLLIADAANDRMLLVDSRKRVVWQFPRPGTTPSFPIHYDDDAFFGPDHHEIISNQEEGQTIVVVSFPEGRITWHYGHSNVAGSGPGYLDTPDDAYLLPDGTRTVADIKNCRILFISPAGRIVRQLGTTGVCSHDPPRSFASPNGDTPMPDGGTLVTEINGSWIDAISASGKLLWSVHAPVSYPSDAQWLGVGRILLADYSSPGAVVIMSTDGKVLWRYAPSAGEARLDHPSLALMLPNGLIAVNDDRRDRVVLISTKTNQIVWQYGHTDVPGTAPGYLHTPDGMDFLPFDVAMADPAIRAVVSKAR